MTITLNFDLLKRWWPALVPASIAAYHQVSPQIKIWVTAHPSASVWIGAAGIFLATLLKSPIAQAAIASDQSLSAAIEKAKKGA